MSMIVSGIVRESKTMTDSIECMVEGACKKVGYDPTRLLDVLISIQSRSQCINNETIDLIAEHLKTPRVQIESVVSFYAFLSKEPKGKIAIYLSSDVIDMLKGAEEVAAALTDELGIEFGQVTDDGNFSLDWTSCIGMSDQAPAALINGTVVTELNVEKSRQIIRKLKIHMDPDALVKETGDGNNSNPLIHSMVRNNIHEKGPIIFGPLNRGDAIRKAVRMSPVEVISALKASRLRGRGGAGFPCGMKWEYTRTAKADCKYIICNADEGEPGTFKDRVILTELPDRIFAGMTIAAYAIGATEGILYLRGEYVYLLNFLEEILQRRRVDGLLGQNIANCEGFHFDIRIQLGAGAYICGEETALISSAEGKRGDPKNRPPFPAQSGYLGFPTSVNNCETLCCVTKILEEGPASFSMYGNRQSTGTKLISISGDCTHPGVYEIDFGISLRELLNLAGAQSPVAVQVGGPSGQLVGVDDFDRNICFDDLPTGGSIMVFDASRDLLQIVRQFMDFFVEESCGYCTPCRVGNVVLKNGMERIIKGNGEPQDLVQFKQTAEMMKSCSRCGLGQTSWKPVITSLSNFPSLYAEKIQIDPDGFQRGFDLKEAVRLSESITGRVSTHSHQK
jgi:[NiFe] hydrogenase diaphorase moiety large subunit